MDEVFYKGEIGRVIRQTTLVDISLGTTAKQVIIRRPDATSVTYTGTDVIVDDQKTGQIHIVTESGDLDQTGEYFMQAQFTYYTLVQYGPLTSFIVEDVLT